MLATAPQSSSTTTGAHHLATEGWCILRGLMPETIMDALAGDLRPVFEATPFCTGDFYGGRTKRFGSLLKRSRHAATLIQCPEMLAIVEDALLPWCDTIQLNLAQAIALHPGAPAQFPHRDQDMWQGIKGEVEYLVNVMWPLTPLLPGEWRHIDLSRKPWSPKRSARTGAALPSVRNADRGMRSSFSARPCMAPARTGALTFGRLWLSAIASAGSSHTRINGSPIRRRWREPFAPELAAHRLSPAPAQSRQL